MLRPEVQYAVTSDGVTIAYSSVGQGPITILLVPGLLSQLEVAWEAPAFEHFMSCLSACAKVVMFDRRGTGLSDRSTMSGERLDLPQLATDVAAVLDSSETDRAVVVGFSMGGLTAVQFAAGYPERTAALILFGATAKLTRCRDFDIGRDPAAVDEWADQFAGAWGSGASVEADAPTMRANAGYREWAGKLERHTCSPGVVSTAIRQAANYDVRHLLTELTAPTLVLHRGGDRAVGVEHGQYLATHIPGASYVELTGEDHTFFLGDQQRILDATIEFLDAEVAHGALGTMTQRAERRNAYGSGWNSLTPSEREIATLAAAGMTNNQIAERLHASPYTVDGRLRRVFTKLGVSTRVGLTTEYARVAP